MKKTLFVFTVAALASACQPQQPKNPNYEQNGPEEVGTYTVTVIDKNIYHLQDCNSSYPAGTVTNEAGEVVGYNNPSDMYLLVGETSALLIDLSNEIKWADNGIESLQKVVADRIGTLPLTVTCTHNHGDHIGMLPAFVSNPAVKFVMPKVDFERMAERFPEKQLTLYDEGYQFDLGGLKLNSLMVPGHTPGSMVFFVEGKDICFSGDAIGSGSGVWIFNMDGYLQYTQSIPKLMEYINNPENHINKEKLIFWGGHYHQRSGLVDGETIGYPYLEETQVLIEQIKDGSADNKSVSYNKLLDTHFTYNNAGIVWNDSLANIIRSQE